MGSPAPVTSTAAANDTDPRTFLAVTGGNYGSTNIRFEEGAVLTRLPKRVSCALLEMAAIVEAKGT